MNVKVNREAPKAESDTRNIMSTLAWLTNRYDIRRNVITGSIECKPSGSDEHYKQANENTFYVQLKSERHVTMADLMAVLNSDFIKTYDPFKEYFDNLPDPVPGTIDRFASYVNAIDKEQFSIHYKKMLVRTIACALDDQVFNRHCFVLMGVEQGTGKSTWERYHVPMKLLRYCTENFASDKDGQIALSQNFIIILDELAGLSKYELNHLKAAFSRDRISVRHPYARKATSEPRRASFMGSTNEENFLTDPTGSTRWLIFEIASTDEKPAINFDYKKDIPIDEVWAEAYQLYKDGFDYRISGQEIQLNEVRNEKYQVISEEEEYISKYFIPGHKGDEFFTATDLKKIIQSMEADQAILKDVQRMGRALSKLGFQRVSYRTNQVSRKGYHAKPLGKTIAPF